RTAEVSIRRALGAERGAIFLQCMFEVGIIGVAGGIVGLALSLVGLNVAAGLFNYPAGLLTHVNGADIAIAIALSIAATLLAGLYPTWRAATVPPAWQLKMQ